MIPAKIIGNFGIIPFKIYRAASAVSPTSTTTSTNPNVNAQQRLLHIDPRSRPSIKHPGPDSELHANKRCMKQLTELLTLYTSLLNGVIEAWNAPSRRAPCFDSSLGAVFPTDPLSTVN